MCGKFTQNYAWPAVLAYLSHWTDAAPAEFSPEAAVTPMRFASVLRRTATSFEFVPMRWGFASAGAADPHRPRHMHARAETIDTLPTFAAAFAARRCVTFVDSFNEGEEVKGRTLQWTISPKDRRPLAIAGIYESWRHGDETLLTFVMITTTPNRLIGSITDRMPALLEPDAIQTWLTSDVKTAKGLLGAFEDHGAWEMAPQKGPRHQRPCAQGELFD